jgi:hypothetical protein
MTTIQRMFIGVLLRPTRGFALGRNAALGRERVDCLRELLRQLTSNWSRGIPVWRERASRVSAPTAFSKSLGLIELLGPVPTHDCATWPAGLLKFLDELAEAPRQYAATGASRYQTP